MQRVFKIILIITALINFNNFLFAQDKQCYKVDWRNIIAYCKDDTTKLFSGECLQSYKNGKIESKSLVKNGAIIYSMRWKKNGKLLDSLIALDSLGNKMVHFYYSKHGRLNLKQTYNRQTKEGLDIFYRRKGAKRAEVNFMNGVRNGLTIQYNKKGQKISEEMYVDNKFVNPAYEWEDGVKYAVIYEVKTKEIGSQTLEIMKVISKTIVK